jgi:hypothetical protein
MAFRLRPPLGKEISGGQGLAHFGAMQQQGRSSPRVGSQMPRDL